MRDIKQSLLQAQKSGQRFDEWRENIEPTLAKKGWLGKTIVTNPVTGENKEIHIGSGRLKTIFTTNMQVAYQVARYDAMQKLDTAVYWRYVSAKLETTRASHARMHGTVLHRDDPFWKKNYPPNGFNCYCTVTAYSKEEVEARGWKIADSTPPTIADKDWAYNVGRAGSNLEEVWKKKVERTACPDKNAKCDDTLWDYAHKVKVVDSKRFKRWYESNSSKTFEIASLRDSHKKALGVGDSKIWLSRKVLLKQKKEHPELKWYEYLLINHIADKAELIIKKGDDVLVAVKGMLSAKYLCVLRATSDKQNTFVASFRRTTDDDIQREKKRGEVIWERQ